MYVSNRNAIHTLLSTVRVACVRSHFPILIYTRDELTPNKERRMRLIYALVAVAEISSIWYLFTDMTYMWIFLDHTSLILKRELFFLKEFQNNLI